MERSRAVARCKRRFFVEFQRCSFAFGLINDEYEFATSGQMICLFVGHIIYYNYEENKG